MHGEALRNPLLPNSKLDCIISHQRSRSIDFESRPFEHSPLIEASVNSKDEKNVNMQMNPFTSNKIDFRNWTTLKK